MKCRKCGAVTTPHRVRMAIVTPIPTGQGGKDKHTVERMGEVDCMEFEIGSETMKNAQNKNGETKTERAKAVGWMHPNQMDVDGFITVGDGVYNGDFVITGVETKSSKLRFNSLEDMIAYPYSHGLMTAIETIAHIYPKRNVRRFSRRIVIFIGSRFDSRQTSQMPSRAMRIQPLGFTWDMVYSGMTLH